MQKKIDVSRHLYVIIMIIVYCLANGLDTAV